MLTLSTLAGSSLGQAPAPAPAKTPDLATIRKTPLAGVDRTNIEAWVKSSVQAIFTATSDADVKKLGQAFYKAVVDNAKAADATPQFREGLGTLVANAFVPAHKAPAANRRPLASVYVLMAMVQIPQPAMLPAFTQGLTDPASGARLLALNGLRAIRDAMTDQQWAALLPELRRVGSAEPNEVTLSRIYRLLAVTSGPKAGGAMPVALDILEARLTRMEQTGMWPAMGDGEIAAWLTPARVGDAARQTRAITLLARLLANATFAYTSVKLTPTQQEEIERVIMPTEEQLTALVKARAAQAAVPSPNVTKATLDAGPNQTVNMRQALTGWIGSENQDGLLNKAPFGLPRGLGLKPPTTTAPASAPAK